MKKIWILCLALLLAGPVCAQDVSKAFPITLVHTEEVTVPSFLARPTTGVKLTWKSSVPGLQFCIAYAGVRDVDLQGRGGQRSYQEDRTHCVVADASGLATDTLRVVTWQDQSGLLIATVVLINNEFNTLMIPVGKLYPQLHY